MIKKIITLFKLGRKIAKSDILNIVSKFQKPPFVITLLFKILSLSFSVRKDINFNKNEGQRLSDSLESMGTTFIKLGQFLATRPDIIGEDLSKQLENLQDKLPPFSLIEAKEIIKNDENTKVDNDLRKFTNQLIHKLNQNINNFSYNVIIANMHENIPIVNKILARIKLGI